MSKGIYANKHEEIFTSIQLVHQSYALLQAHILLSEWSTQNT